MEAELEDGGPRLGTPTYVEVETRRLRSGNVLVDGELQRRLDSRQFPRIRGELTLHGVTRTLDVEVTVRQLDPSTLEIEGRRAID